MPSVQMEPSRTYDRRYGTRFSARHPSFSRGRRDHPRTASVATWTVLVEERPVAYASRLRWREQPRPERGAPPESFPEPFRVNTLEVRHPVEPPAIYSDA